MAVAAAINFLLLSLGSGGGSGAAAGPRAFSVNWLMRHCKNRGDGAEMPT
jgi:hypothetical protein